MFLSETLVHFSHLVKQNKTGIFPSLEHQPYIVREHAVSYKGVQLSSSTGIGWECDKMWRVLGKTYMYLLSSLLKRGLICFQVMARLSM